MKPYIRAKTLTLTASLACALAVSAGAFTPVQKSVLSHKTGKESGRTAVVDEKTAELTTLEQAYVILANANQDYKGHRVEAMKEIKEAAKLMGVKFRGEGKGHERQSVSDAQLREAQALLEKTSGELQANKQEKPLKHVNAAIAEVSAALKVR
jgi:hypothetical protein